MFQFYFNNGFKSHLFYVIRTKWKYTILKFLDSNTSNYSSTTISFCTGN
jgi:hypothetical protein